MENLAGTLQAPYRRTNAHANISLHRTLPSVIGYRPVSLVFLAISRNSSATAHSVLEIVSVLGGFVTRIFLQSRRPWMAGCLGKRSPRNQCIWLAEKSRRSVIKRFARGVGSSCVLPAGVEKPQETTKPDSHDCDVSRRVSDVAMLLRRRGFEKRGEKREKETREKTECFFVAFLLVFLSAGPAVKFAPNLPFQWKCFARVSN